MISAMPDLQPTSDPSCLTWHEAPSELLARCHEIHHAAPQKRPTPLLTIGITGPVGSGKSTLADILAQPPHALVLATDNYLPDYAAIPPAQRDEPSHADLALLAEHITTLRAGHPINMPIWSFHAHRRVGYESFTPPAPPDKSSASTAAPAPPALLIIEGIFALSNPVRAHIDIAIYIDSPQPDRWQRWKKLERTGTRGWGVDKAKDFFYAIADPTFHRYAPTYRANADYIVMNPTLA